MNKIPAFSVIIVFLALCIVGASLIPFLTLQLLPSRTLASATVHCYMPDATPETTELELTTPIEDVLSRLKGIKSMNSLSWAGTSYVNLALDKWTDPEMFRFEAAMLLRQLKDKLPENASYPIISLNRPDANSGSSRSILQYSINGPGSPADIAAYVEETFRPALAAIKGIYRIDISGTRPRRLEVVCRDAALQQLGISHDEVSQAVQRRLSSAHLGTAAWDHSNERANIVLTDVPTSPAALQELPLLKKGDRIFRLSELAEIALVPTPPSSYYRINGQNLVSLSIYPEEHVNTLLLASQIKAEVARITGALPQGYRVEQRYDDTEFIKKELGKIYLRTGLSVAILLTFVFILARRVRYLSIIVAGLTANVLISFIFYYLFGLEIHLYSLAGVTISLGLIVDNMIVIVDDIRHTGKNRIFAAILASTLTALGALSVIFFLEEQQRVNLVDFAIAIIVNLLVSLPVAYLLIPALLEKFPVPIRKNRVYFKRKRGAVRFSRWYLKQIGFMSRFRTAFILLFVLLFGLPVFLLPEEIEKETFWAKVYNKTLGSDFYNLHLRPVANKALGGTLRLFIEGGGSARYGNDDEQRTTLHVSIKMPNGATLSQMNAVTREFEHYLRGFPQLDVFTASVSGPNQARIAIYFKEEYENGGFPFRLKQLLESKAVYSGAADFGVYGVGQGFSNEIRMERFDSSITLKGYNYEQLYEYASLVRDSLRRYARVKDIVITTEDRWSYRSRYEFEIAVNRPEELALAGIGKRGVTSYLSNLTDRYSTVGDMRVGDEQVPVIVRSNKERIAPVWTVMNAPSAGNTPSGALRPASFTRLGTMSTVEKHKVGQGIYKENREYRLNVHYFFVGTYMLNSLVQEKVVETVNELLPFGYQAYRPYAGNPFGGGGDYRYLWMLLLVLGIIFGICAVLLESLVQPLAVICMIPFSFIGVFLTFYWLNLSFEQGGYASLLMLSGLVTNAALYIINDVNFLRKKRSGGAVPARQLFVRAYNHKIIPIGITTASAILGLAPFMLAGEEGGFWFTLSAGTIGGLVFSIAGVYLLLPLFFSKKQEMIAKNRR